MKHGLKRRMMYGFMSVVWIVLLVLQSSVGIGSSASVDIGSEDLPEEIYILLDYNSGTVYDADDDGVEGKNSIIDFSVENSFVPFSYDSSSLCTRWEVYSYDEDVLHGVCHGSDYCCGILGLISLHDSWSAPLYLGYGRFGASERSQVSAQILYVKHPSEEGSYDVFDVSAWDSLDATFVEGYGDSYSSLSEDVTVDDVLFTIVSPVPGETLDSGESVVLNVTSNISGVLYFSLDNEAYSSLGEGTSFSGEIEGGLTHSIVSHGSHNISLVFEDGSGDNHTHVYSFSVNDVVAPSATLNVTNNTAFEDVTSIPILVSSDEFSKITVVLNGIIEVSDEGMGNDKEYVFSADPEVGVNTLAVSVEDYQGNERSYYYEFTYSESACDDGIENGDETGVDCGGSCGTCISLSLTMSKSVYNVSDDVYLTVEGRADSVVNVSVSTSGSVVEELQFVPAFSGAPISETRLLSSGDSVGSYFVFGVLSYMDTTEEKLTSFSVVEPPEPFVSVSIEANTTEIEEGEMVAFSSKVSGNTTPVSFKWDFTNDGTVDSTSPNPEYAFGSNGTYVVNVSVENDEGYDSDTIEIDVRKRYSVMIWVRDNETHSIDKALVTFDGVEKNTSSDGRATFSVLEGDHSLRVEKRGYFDFSNTTTISNGNVQIVTLLERDAEAPRVQLIVPEENGVISETEILFSYRAFDKSSMTCTILTSRDNASWIRQGSIGGVRNDVQQSDTVNLSEGSHYWRVECQDTHGHRNTSDVRVFTIDTSRSSDEIVALTLDEEAKYIQSEVQGIRESLKRLDSRHKEVVGLLQIESRLEKAELEVDRAIRDLNSLKWRRLNDTDLDVEKQKILDRVENVKSTTPKGLIIVDSDEYVKYADKNAILSLVEILGNQTNKKFSKKDYESLAELNQAKQSGFTVTTNYYVVDMEYIGGNVEPITLIEKSVEVGAGNEDLVFYEVIPKEFAENIDDVETFFDYVVIEEDPVIEVDVEKHPKLVYYVSGVVDKEVARGAHSIIIDPTLEPEERKGFIGFAVFDDIQGAIADGGDTRLIIEVIIIVILCLVFLFYQFGGSEKVTVFVDSSVRDSRKELESLTGKINGFLADHNYEEAKLIYKEVESLFNQLPKEKRKYIIKDVMRLRHRLDYAYIMNMVSKAMKHLTEKEKEQAKKIYLKIRPFYKNVSHEYKTKVVEKCMELHKKLHQ